MFFIADAKDSKLELGVGAGSIYYPNYIGSKSYTVYSIPFPYIKYESEYLTVDKDGITQNLFNNKDLTLDMSLAGTLPSDSEDNILRTGMPDLNFTFEVGPKLMYKLYDTKSFDIFVEIATRMVFETDFTMLDTQGFVGTTEMRFEYESGEFELTYRSGLKFADEKYNSYFYGVDRQYATKNRNYYEASSGYSGFKNRVGVTYKKENWWYGAFCSHHSLNNTVMIDSPLVETNYAFYTGASIAYIFYVD